MFYSLVSYAKCNAFLTVTGRRDDGYHELMTFMMYINLFDRINIFKITTNKGISIETTGKFSYKINNLNIKQNTVYRAISEIEKIYQIKSNFNIKIEKNIPIASGLGGGSSNAGVIINFYNNYFNLGMTNKEKVSIANKVGADVSFFLQDSGAICYGIGDIICPIEISKEVEDYTILIIDPMAKFSTKNVYDNYRSLNISTKKLKKVNIENYKSALKMEIAARLGLEIDVIKETINCTNVLTDLSDLTMISSKRIMDFIKTESSPIRQFISGGGSSFIVVFENKTKAHNLLTRLKINFPNIYVRMANFISKINSSY